MDSIASFLEKFDINTNLEDQIYLYGRFHQNPYNQAIHWVFIPVIWATAIAWLAYTPILFPGAPYWLNWSFVVYSLYAIFYLYLDFEVAIFVNLVYLMIFFVINRMVYIEKVTALHIQKASSVTGKPNTADLNKVKPSYRAAKIALGLHILGWWMQIVPGHRWMEGNQPAIKTSFIQSLLFAPLFVFYEAVWFLFPNFRNELHSGLNHRLEAFNMEMK